MPDVKMKVENIDPKTLVPYERNARTHTDAQIAAIASSIRQFGFTKPVVIDENGMILAGHGATRAALMIDMDRVPCVRRSDLSDEQKRAYIIADNRLSELSGWDIEVLALEITDLQAVDFDLSPFEFEALLPSVKEGGPNRLVGGNRHLLMLECESEVALQAMYEEMQKRNIACKIIT